MTNDNTNSLSRRTVLKGAATMGAFSVVGVPAFASGTVGAASTETLYLSSSEPASTGPGQITRVFSVNLNATTTDAELTEIYATPQGSNFQRVDAIAAARDGETIYMIDRDTQRLGELDISVSPATFSDEGVVSGLGGRTVLAAVGPDGVLYAASNNTEKLYSIDLTTSPPTATVLTTLSDGVSDLVNGADIAFGSDGTMYFHSNTTDTTYTVDYDPSSATYGDVTALGVSAGVNLTGMAVRDNGSGDLVGSSRATDDIIAIDRTNGSAGTRFDMTLNGSAYNHRNGDMTLGVLGCADCDDSGLLAKYEFECVEEVDDECVDWDFVLEDGDGSLVSYDSFESKDGEMFEPISATFETNYCSVWAVVKAGPKLEVQELTADDDGLVTAANIDQFAISYVAFFCTEAEADEYVASFPGGGPNR